MYQKQVSFEMPDIDSKQQILDKLDPIRNSHYRPVIPSSEDKTKISKERNKFRLFTQLKKMRGNVNKCEFASYYYHPTANTAPVAVSSHGHKLQFYTDKSRTVNAYHTLVDSQHLNKKSNSVLVQEPEHTRDWELSHPADSLSVSPLGKQYSSPSLEQPAYKDNIKRFSETGTMTSTVVDASCTAGAARSIVSDSSQATSSNACCQTKAEKKVVICECHPKPKKNNKRKGKKCNECANVYKSENDVPDPSATDDDWCCEETATVSRNDGLRDCMNRNEGTRDYYMNRNEGTQDYYMNRNEGPQNYMNRNVGPRDCCMNRNVGPQNYMNRNEGPRDYMDSYVRPRDIMQEIPQYNRNRPEAQRKARKCCDKSPSRHVPRRPRSTLRPGSPCCSTPRTVSPGPPRPREPPSPRPKSKYHLNCTHADTAGRPQPACTHNFANCCGNKYFSESPARPRRLLTSERNIDAFIDRTRLGCDTSVH